MAKPIFTENQSSFEDVGLAHQVIEAIRSSGNTIEDEQAFIKRMRHVEYGLNSETECSAILSWLGNCSLVHKISGEGNIPEDMKIPDLFAVFEKNGQVLKVFIEVKSTEGFELRWTNHYYSKLKRYCDIFDYPLLLSWKFRPFGQWLLLDLQAPNLIKNEKICFGDGMRENLMGVIAGDFRVTPKAGLGIHFTGQILRKEKISTKESNVNLKITKCFWGDYQRNELKNLSEAELALIMMLANNHYYREEKDTATWGYTTYDSDSQEQTDVSAQDLLRFIVGFAKKEKQKIAWRSVLQNLNEIKSKSDLST